MTINQLFKKQPSEDLLKEIINLLGYKEYTDDITFTKNEIMQTDTFEEIKKKMEILREYYLPCKKKVYFDNLDHKKIITILRQNLKLYGYKIESKEQLCQGNKILRYRIIKNLKETGQIITNSKCTLVFD